MTLPQRPRVTGLSGDRFRVLYTLIGDESDVQARALDICLEQTVEFPGDLVPDGDIRDHIVGQIDSLDRLDDRRYAAWISYAVETVGAELTQFLNVVFGNISIKPGIRVEQFDLPDSLLAQFKGPRFGVWDWRKLLNVPVRPLLCTALKPMGLSAAELAKLAGQFALGGLDLIKDDHGLANQPFAPFEERVERCAEAVARANAQTGLRCAYMPNITAPADQVLERARFAKQAGAGALLICPGLVSFDVMRQIADSDDIDLPIMSHPSFYGSFVTHEDNGVSHYALYGQLQRLAGADASIYPNFGGRFAFTRAQCEQIVAGCAVPMGQLKPIFPTPGGGMNMHSIPTIREVCGQHAIYLIGGGLHRHSADLVANVQHFLNLVETH
ncbi:MAG: ribulose 1,5-bisphosphate carboxylase large subunit [Chloroflexi bacterium]|nr:ribulose 1,5-bisphosphate carboxylase large subunit [Chloroflexota bacterium]